MTTPPAIRIDNLVKRYDPSGPGDEGKLALKGVSFDVPQGGVFGLLGPNGAGKSTIINILAGLVRKTSGSAEIWGFDTDGNPRNAKRSIGIVPQEIVFDPFFTPFEVLENQGGFYGIPKADRRSEDLLAAVHLSDKRDAYARTLSGGMKRRVLIAKALSHQPRVLFLDEPTAGVDVALRREMWQVVEGLRRDGVTIILTTHYLEEAEEMADRIGVINRGELLLMKPKDDLMGEFGRKSLTIELDAPLTAVPKSVADRGLVLSEDGRAIRYDYDTRAERTGIARLLGDLAGEGVTVRDVSTRQSSLEEVFMTLVNEDRKAEDAA